MKVYQAILKRRSIRRFKQKKISLSVLKKLVNAARLAPSAANLQPCEYIIVNQKEKLGQVFHCTRWAGYLPDGTPFENLRPTAYITVLLNSKKPMHAFSRADASAAVENMLLLAVEEGLGSCWIGSLDRDKLKKILKVPKHCEIDSIVALGFPAEKSKAEPFVGDVKYWRCRQGNFHVPKRSLKEILHANKY